MDDTGTSIEQLNREWLRNKLSTLWTAPQHCGLCLETTGELYPLNAEFLLGKWIHTKSLKDIINTVLVCDVQDFASSEMICKQCADNAIQSYVFTENTKRIFNLIKGCVNDLLSKVTDLNNELEGSQTENYTNSNVMIVVEYDNEVTDKVDKAPRLYNNRSMKNLAQKELNSKKLDGKVIPQNNESKPIPTQRVVKYPRTKEIVKEDKPIPKDNTPTFTLEGGKIVIAPLTINSPSTPKYNTYSCSSCPSIFTTYRSLKEHEKSLHNIIIYQCRFCSKTYNSQQYLDVHYVNNHSKKRCRYCHELFDTKELNGHLRSVHKEQVNFCQYCDLVYHTPEQLETHFKSAHLVSQAQTNDNNKTQCVMCLRNFNDSEIKMHKCKFSCLECLSAPCVHYSYLMSYREQILNHITKIRCIDCDFTTKRKEHLIGHVNREHLDHHPFTCHDCGTQFYTKLSMKTHIMQFHQDLKCQYCDYEFKNLQLLQNHRDLCKGISRSVPCELCVASFDTDSELKNHMSLNHSEIVYPCTLCKKEFTNESTLKDHHIKIHSGIQYKKRRKFIECTLCDVTFNNIKEMLKHEELHDTNVMYPCKVCPKSFSSLRQMYVHKQKHYSQRTKCHNCGKSVSTAYLSQHMVVCASFKTNRPFSCDKCGKEFNVESALMSHLRFHAKPYVPCEYCEKLIKVTSMKHHIETKHTIGSESKATFECDLCNYTAKKRVDYENHMNKLHLKIKPFVCQVCSKAFCGKARLDEHAKTHTDNNVCFCSFCGKKFANKVCLKMHTRKHTGEKPYECNICYEKFRSSSIMKTHRLKKHQDKTIQCPLCDSMYHLVAEMRFHVKKIHWKSPDPFDFRQIVPEEFHHLFEDRRLQKLGEGA